MTALFGMLGHQLKRTAQIAADAGAKAALELQNGSSMDTIRTRPEP